MAGRCVVLLSLYFGILCQILAFSAAQDQVVQACSNDDVPMCAQSTANGMNFLFRNECDLRKAQRSNLMGAPIYEVSLRNCFPNCEFECSTRQRPVCGVSSQTGHRRTFKSRCEMIRTSCLSGSEWLVQQWGVCPKENSLPQNSQKPLQPVRCTKIYRPVCAMYAGVKSTFSNECLVNAENVKTQRNWRIVSQGLCGEDSLKMKQSYKQKPQTKPKVDADRTKRSNKYKNNRLSQSDDFQIPEDAVQIYAPSTFHTQFISQTGAMEKSYSLPARKPYVVSPQKPKVRKVYGSRNSKNPVKSCVFGNDPICGTFKSQRRTFSSVCDLMEYSQRFGNAWTISHDGACRQCDKPCPTVIQPICATRNGFNHTIINECYLERVRCKDPASIWKLVHKGECPMPLGNKPQGIHTKKIKPLSVVPVVLYGKNIFRQSSTEKTNLKKVATTKKITTTHKPQHHLKSTTIKTPLPSLEPNNRKIRKIELSGFTNFSGSKLSNYVKSDEDAFWSSNDNWLIGKTLDNVNGFFNKKPASFKKTYVEKKPPSYKHFTNTVRAPLTTSTTTTVAPPPQLPVFVSFSSPELLDLDFDNKPTIFGDDDAQLLQMLTTKMTTTTTSATPVPSTTQPSTTELATSIGTTEATTYPEDTTSVAVEITSEDSLGFTDPETTEEVLISSTTDAPPQTTTEPEELYSQTTDGTETPTTTSATELSSSTQNADYTADELSAETSGQTSIYGLDKNSLIMRLLRARSSQNVLI
ncbi:uncharacterized protein Dana_GF16370 [Drosophila ananassae]|uniref:Kazal-like domain-containing protein n=1 Tax=Drosophila ananassae TaxID=7217 RepID=B3LVW0_DROAN|nr:uncharacterized protein LOC6499166 [Drosophila ananassae]EDV43734.1 uncharacterized protein Dana_GF16370 [Drosophila ananassae]